MASLVALLTAVLLPTFSAFSDLSTYKSITVLCGYHTLELLYQGTCKKQAVYQLSILEKIAHLQASPSGSTMKVKKEVRTIRKQKFYLYLNDIEQRIVLQSIVRLKNRLIQEGRYTNIVDEAIVKLLDATWKKVAV